MFSVAYWRAKEGELARTILASPGVRAARVHIAVPNRRPFARDGASPTASVTVTVAGGTLTPDQADLLSRYAQKVIVAFTDGGPNYGNDSGDGDNYSAGGYTAPRSSFPEYDGGGGGHRRDEPPPAALEVPALHLGPADPVEVGEECVPGGLEASPPNVIALGVEVAGVAAVEDLVEDVRARLAADDDAGKFAPFYKGF